MAQHTIRPDISSNRLNSQNITPRRTLQQENPVPNTAWCQWPLIKLRIENLPPSTRTLHVYRNLARYGNITRITLSEEKAGQRTITSDVVFEPPPEEYFWDRHNLEFSIDGQRAYPRIRLDRYQPATKLIKSPLQNGVQYREKNELQGTSLGFGVLSNPTTMLLMTNRGDAERQPKLVLNLWKKEIEVYFPILHMSFNSNAWRDFRFIIALDDELTIWRLPNEEYILHLPKPPWYSKKLVQAVHHTHAVGARRWSEEDTWARQADIFAHKSTLTEIQSLPVKLHKELNEINIFRWTTYHFRTLPQSRTDGSAKIFFDALHDWNINISDGEGFKIRDLTQSSLMLEKDLWALIDSTHNDKNVFSLSEELSRISLPFSVRYQLEVCLSHNWLSEHSITPDFLHRLSQWGEENAKQALIYVDTNQEQLYDPMTLFSDIQYSKPIRPKPLPDNCIEIHSATVTATGILFHTPTVEITNRIIRNHRVHAHRFLRVRFADDEYRGQSRLYPSTNNKMIMIFDRVKRALTRGIKLGSIQYDFLAWGNSQLREHGVYFFAAIDGVDADRIRIEMGNFEEVIVAKKCARMGQCFSSTKAVHLRLPPITMSNVIPDVIRGGYNFTDGAGKISMLAASLVSDQLGMKTVPSLFQFRLGGCKGVLAISKDVPGTNVLIRKSQFKFSSLSGELEIIRCAEFWQAFLNRQIIICLDNLGVRSEIFLSKQNDAINALGKALEDDSAAVKALRTNVDPNRMTLSLAELVEAGFRTSKDPFVSALLHLWRAWSLKYLKEKAKIPVTEGAFVLGSVDETGVLRGHTRDCPTGERKHIEQDPLYMERLPQIFLQIKDPQTGQRRVIEGLCILARNPSLHAGDIRVVRAVNIPDLSYMCDVVVMPQTGDRDLPSMCSGGDLDGDDYIVIWDKTLIPNLWNVEPFHYDPPHPKVAKGEITTTDMINFFCDYLQNDSLGRIATAHLAAADGLSDSLWNQSCLELAALHSRAVDYPKTGVPARMERRHERNQWPHFMEKKSLKEYHSNKVLGKLYDAVQKTNFSPDWNLPFDSRILHTYQPSKTLYEAVQNAKKDYDSSLRRILNQHAISTEFELWSTFVLHHSKAARDFKFHEEVGMLSRTLKEQFYEVLTEIAEGKDYDHLAPVAVTAYRCTYDQLQVALNEVELGTREYKPDSMPFISFPWILQDILIKIVIRSNDTDSGGIMAGIQKGDILGLGQSDLQLGSTGHTPLELQNDHGAQSKIHHFSEHLPDPYQTHRASLQFPIQMEEPSHLDSSDPARFGNEDKGKGISTSDAPFNAHITMLTDDTSQGSDSMDKKAVLEGKFEAMTNSLKTVHEVKLADEPDDIAALLDFIEASNIAKEISHGPASTILEPAEEASHIQAEAVTPSMPLLDPPTITQLHEVADVDRAIPRREKQVTFQFWRHKDNCMYTAEECHRAHYDTGNYGPMLKETCWFWKNNGKCVNSAERCLFAHYDTGLVAPRPYRSAVVSSQLDKGSLASPTKRIVDDDSDSDDELDHTNESFAWPTQQKYRSPLLNSINAARYMESQRSFLPQNSYPSHPTSFSYGRDIPHTTRTQPAGYDLPLKDIGFDQARIPADWKSRSQNEGLDSASREVRKTGVPSNDHRGDAHIAGLHTKNTGNMDQTQTKSKNSLDYTSGSTKNKALVDNDDGSMLSGVGPQSRPLADPFETASGIADYGSDVVLS